MRIACVQTFPVDYCIDYVNAIASLGQVTFFAADRRMRNHADFVDPSVETVLLPWPRHRSPRNLGLMYRLRREILMRDPDVIHFLGDDVTWLSLMPSLVGSRPTLVTSHDVTYHPGDTNSTVIPQAVIGFFQRQATRIVVHGERIKKEIAEEYNRPLREFSTVPHPALLRYAEVARRESLAPRTEGGPFKLLFFGRVMTYKGLPHLLDAMDLLKTVHDDLELTIAGEGPGYDQVINRLDQPFIKTFRGFVPDVDAARHFIEADLVVLPHLVATQSGILAMASAFGRAVVVTDAGELGNIVRETSMGLIVPPGDSRALADAIRTIREQPSLKAELEANSAAAAMTGGALSHDTVAKAAAVAYRDAIDDRSSMAKCA